MANGAQSIDATEVLREAKSGGLNTKISSDFCCCAGLPSPNIKTISSVFSFAMASSPVGLKATRRELGYADSSVSCFCLESFVVLHIHSQSRRNDSLKTSPTTCAFEL